MRKTRSYHDRFYYTDEEITEPDLVHQQAYAAQIEREAKIWQRRLHQKAPNSASS